MPLFRCFIRGENFPGVLIGKDEPIGFYTTRFIEAENPQQAETRALELLRNDSALHLEQNHRTEDARVNFESIDEVPAESEQKPNRGFTFFGMDA